MNFYIYTAAKSMFLLRRNSQQQNPMKEIANPKSYAWLMYGDQTGEPLQRHYGQHSLFGLSLYHGLPPIQTRSVVAILAHREVRAVASNRCRCHYALAASGLSPRFGGTPLEPRSPILR
jgi:hypothetical protein